ncbi:MAG: formate dehydrogenase accessory sulfurtransferase FdhD [Halocynthiibacter sp.]
MASDKVKNNLLIGPDPSNARLSKPVQAVNEFGVVEDLSVITEVPLTIYLNSQEIVTAMTIGDYPEYLALGFLRNQRMLRADEVVTAVVFDEETEAVIVRTERATNYEEKLKRRTRTSGCAVGTVFGDVMDGLDDIHLPEVLVKTSWIYTLSKAINQMPSLYLTTGAIHGTVLCQEDQPLVYMEDVGRHNAVDKIAGWLFSEGQTGRDKILYTTGRLTSEMVIKTIQMEIPVLISRSGFTAWGVEIAEKYGLTLIGRLRGQRFQCVSGHKRLTFDIDPTHAPKEDAKLRRKGAKQ